GIEAGGGGEGGGWLLLMARPGVRLQGGAKRNQPPARQGEGGARAEVRSEGLQRHGRARRQRAARRPREEHRRIHSQRRKLSLAGDEHATTAKGGLLPARRPGGAGGTRWIRTDARHHVSVPRLRSAGRQRGA